MSRCCLVCRFLWRAHACVCAHKKRKKAKPAHRTRFPIYKLQVDGIIHIDTWAAYDDWARCCWGWPSPFIVLLANAQHNGPWRAHTHIHLNGLFCSQSTQINILFCSARPVDVIRMPFFFFLLVLLVSKSPNRNKDDDGSRRAKRAASWLSGGLLKCY